MELFVVTVCTRRHSPGDSSLAGARRQPWPAPSPSTQLPTLSQSAPVAARARTLLSPWAFGSQSQAWPGGHSLEAGMGLRRPRRRQRCTGRTSTLAAAHRQTQSPLRSERDGIQTQTGTSPRQTRAGAAQARQRLGVSCPTSAAQTPTDTPAASWGRAQRADVLTRGRGLPADVRTAPSNPRHWYNIAAPTRSRKQILSGAAAWTCPPES